MKRADVSSTVPVGGLASPGNASGSLQRQPAHVPAQPCASMRHCRCCCLSPAPSASVLLVISINASAPSSNGRQPHAAAATQLLPLAAGWCRSCCTPRSPAGPPLRCTRRCRGWTRGWRGGGCRQPRSASCGGSSSQSGCTSRVGGGELGRRGVIAGRAAGGVGVLCRAGHCKLHGNRGSWTTKWQQPGLCAAGCLTILHPH